jgi:transcriptional regulator with XRE-family HTH domain
MVNRPIFSEKVCYTRDMQTNNHQGEGWAVSAEHFAGRLKELREQAGLTQQQLADKAGIGKDSVAQLEQGRNQASWAFVLALADALGITPNDFRQAAASRVEVKRGRPKKAKTLTEQAPAEPARRRGRPRKEEKPKAAPRKKGRKQ